jgi:hypothetical protein
MTYFWIKVDIITVGIAIICGIFANGNLVILSIQASAVACVVIASLLSIRLYLFPRIGCFKDDGGKEG